MNKAVLATVGIVAVLLVIGGFFFPRNKEVKVVETRVGAVSGPELSSPFWTVGGVRGWYFDSPITANASTSCTFKLPAATTTLMIASENYYNLASTTVVEIGYSAGIQATTTLLSSIVLTASGLNTSAIATTSQLQLFFAPNAYINYKTGGAATGKTVTETGRCKLIVHEV